MSNDRPLRVLFVCTGNICRSPVGEYLLRSAVDRSGIADVTVSSAGTSGLSGHRMDPRSLDFLNSHGIDGSRFTARRLNRRLLKETDLVIGLEQSHVDEILTLHPGALARTVRLRQLAGWCRSGDLTVVSDLPTLRHSLPVVPGGHEDPVLFTSRAEYRRVLDEIASDISAVSSLLTTGR